MDAPAPRDVTTVKVAHRATTPLAGAVAGIIFAVLFSASMTILRQTVGDIAHDSGAWLSGDTGLLKLALALVPFAGIAFLWFIAVARERLGRFEDQFFSTVFIGSGLLFLAMVFAAAATAARSSPPRPTTPRGSRPAPPTPTRGRRSRRSSRSTRCAWRPCSCSRRPRCGCAPV